MLVEMIADPLSIWLEQMRSRTFPKSAGTEASDVMAEAIALAATKVLGRAAAHTLAIEILDNQSIHTRKPNGK